MKDLKDAKIVKKSATDQVANKIISYLKDGTWKTGDKLPSEAELAELFGVNRLTVRMVIQKLNTIGILETKNGVGTHVIPFNFEEYIDEASIYYMSDDLLDHVSEFRHAIELPSIDLAIKRASSDDFEILKKLLDDYTDLEHKILTAPSKDLIEKIAKADIAFHKQIVHMSHNTLFVYTFKVCEKVIFEYILKLMKHRLRQSKKLSVSNQTNETRYDNIHTEIYEALKEKNADLCKQYYIKMIEHSDIKMDL